MNKMLRSKDKMYLRKLANSIKPVFQIGKEGLNDNMTRDILLYLNKHELMKIKLLETAPLSPEEAATAFMRYEIEVAQIIGRTLVLYKHSDEVDDPITFN